MPGVKGRSVVTVNGTMRLHPDIRSVTTLKTGAAKLLRVEETLDRLLDES